MREGMHLVLVWWRSSVPQAASHPANVRGGPVADHVPTQRLDESRSGIVG